MSWQPLLVLLVRGFYHIRPSLKQTFWDEFHIHILILYDSEKPCHLRFDTVQTLVFL